MLNDIRVSKVFFVRSTVYYITYTCILDIEWDNIHIIYIYDLYIMDHHL